jgi:hypothetical protein
MPRRQLLTAVTAALVAVSPAMVMTAGPAIASGPSVVLVGHGYGHGRGLSQWGAYGYAVDQGWTAGRILDHYYGGTKAGSIGHATITVALTSLYDRQRPLDYGTGSWITSDKEFMVGGMRIAAGAAARIVPTSTGWATYTSFGGCSHPNNFGPYPVSSPEVKLAPKTGTTIQDTLVICSNQRGYQGTLKVASSGSLKVFVNTLPMEQYLRAVVPREAPASWGSARGGLGMEALKAQAVAARSYAWSERRYAYAKTCDTTACQVYGGRTLANQDQTDRRSDWAVSRTAGQVRVFSSTGVVARTEFSASSGGWTAGGTFPGVEDRGDSRSPRHTWTALLDGSKIASRYGVGTFRRLTVWGQDGRGPGGGRAKTVRIEGSSSTKDVPAAVFRSHFGLSSDWFYPVGQPIKQVTSLSFRRLAHSDKVYVNFGNSSAKWQDHAHLNWAAYVAFGKPPVTAMSSDYVKYSWSPTVYAVTYWPQEPYWQWDMLDEVAWKRAGSPKARIAGFIYGTIYFKYGSDPAIYAQAPDGVVHHLTWSEWKAAGFPEPQIR